MPNPSPLWKINSTSQFHFHPWPDGVAVYLEGEGSTYLLNPIAAELLNWLSDGQMSTQALANKLSLDFPDDTPDAVFDVVEATMSELRSRGFVTQEQCHHDE